MFMKKILIKNSQIVVHTTSQKTLTDSFKYQYNNLIIVLSYYLIFQEKIINLNHFKMWLQHSRPTKTKSLSYSSILSLHPISDDRASIHGRDKVERMSNFSRPLVVYGIPSIQNLPTQPDSLGYHNTTDYIRGPLPNTTKLHKEWNEYKKWKSLECWVKMNHTLSMGEP